MRHRSWAAAVLAPVLLAAGCGGPSVRGAGTAARPAAPRTSATPAARPAGCAGACLDDPALAATVVAAARADLALVESYDYRHLDAAQARGLAVSTGAFRDQYRTLMTTVVRAAAARSRAVQRFTVSRAGVAAVDARGAGARVLVFGTLHVSNAAVRERADPVVVTVTMVRVGGRWLISQLFADARDGAVAGNPGLLAAIAAARQEMAAVISFSRAHFDADYARAVDGATGALRADLVARERQTRTTLTDGGFDLVGKVTAVAVESAQGSTVRLLVGTEGSRSTATDGPVQERLAVTVVPTGSGWKVSEVRNVG